MDIIPTYRCNLNCPFCFNKDNWTTDGILDLDYFQNVLDNNKGIKELAIIGGEPSLLPEEYLYRLSKMCCDYLVDSKPDLYTNLLLPISKRILDNVNLHVSYDPVDRKYQNRVLNNMLELECDFSVNMIITKNLINEYGISKIDRLANTLKKEICLSKINVVTTHGIEYMQPTPGEIINFTLKLKEANNPYIKSSLLRILNKDYEHNKPASVRFDYNVSINPDGRFQTSGLHGMEKIYRDSYEECFKEYEKAFKESETCKQCKFNAYCIDEYRKGDSCYNDKIIMQAFEDYNK